MNNTITAQELKTKGISIADTFAAQGLETIVTVRGEPKYIIITKAEFHNLKEHELTVALAEAQEDIKNGKYHSGTIDEHISKITNA